MIADSFIFYTNIKIMKTIYQTQKENWKNDLILALSWLKHLEG